MNLKIRIVYLLLATCYLLPGCENPFFPDRKVKKKGSGIEMASIPAGTFIMGSPNSEYNRNSGTESQVSVTLTTGFKMSKYPVTQGQWDAVMSNKFEVISGGTTIYGVGYNYPVYFVTWYDALEFCDELSKKEGLQPVYNLIGITRNGTQNITSATVNALFSRNGYRLPTEAQWEYACRGDYPNKATEYDTKPFGIGDGTKLTSSMANFNGLRPYDLAQNGEYYDSGGTYLGRTTEVGSYAANNYGLYDMHGNVWEWCYDSWNGSDDNVSGDNPIGDSGDYRVLRGGSWFYNARNARSARRDYGNPSGSPNGRDGDIGFRLVLP